MCITDNNIIIDKLNKLTLQLVGYICILLKRFFGVSLLFGTRNGTMNQEIQEKFDSWLRWLDKWQLTSIQTLTIDTKWLVQR